METVPLHMYACISSANEALRTTLREYERIMSSQAAMLAEQSVLIKQQSLELSTQSTEIAAQKVIITAQSAEISKLTARVAELEKQANKTSENSSKPPSSDGFKKVVQNNREKTDRKRGGQPGHKGHKFEYYEGDEISQTVYVAVSGTCSCGISLVNSGKVSGYTRRQVIDLPELKPFVTEYQVEKKQCTCGKMHLAKCVAPYAVQYGNGVLAASNYFQNRQFIPVARTQEIFLDFFGFKQLSQATIQNASEIGFDRLEDWETKQLATLQSADLLHVDETGCRVGGVREWGHVCSTAEITLYQYHAKRGKVAHQDHQIIPNFTGILVHDRYSSYNQYACTHSLCNAHLLRDLKGLISDKTPAVAWATLMYALINEAHNAKVTAEVLEERYATIVENGLKANPQPTRKPEQKGKLAKTDSLNLLECFRDRKNDILRFFYHEFVPFDNNLAERDLRMFKLKEKISGCFRTESGAKTFCRNASFIATLKKQGLNVWKNLCNLYQHNKQWA